MTTAMRACHSLVSGLVPRNSLQNFGLNFVRYLFTFRTRVNSGQLSPSRCDHRHLAIRSDYELFAAEIPETQIPTTLRHPSNHPPIHPSILPSSHLSLTYDYCLPTSETISTNAVKYYFSCRPSQGSRPYSRSLFHSSETTEMLAVESTVHAVL